MGLDTPSKTLGPGHPLPPVHIRWAGHQSLSRSQKLPDQATTPSSIQPKTTSRVTNTTLTLREKSLVVIVVASVRLWSSLLRKFPAIVISYHPCAPVNESPEAHSGAHFLELSRWSKMHSEAFKNVCYLCGHMRFFVNFEIRSTYFYKLLPLKAFKI